MPGEEKPNLRTLCRNGTFVLRAALALSYLQLLLAGKRSAMLTAHIAAASVLRAREENGLGSL